MMVLYIAQARFQAVDLKIRWLSMEVWWIFSVSHLHLAWKTQLMHNRFIRNNNFDFQLFGENHDSHVHLHCSNFFPVGNVFHCNISDANWKVTSYLWSIQKQCTASSSESDVTAISFWTWQLEKTYSRKPLLQTFFVTKWFLLLWGPCDILSEHELPTVCKQPNYSRLNHICL